MAQPRLLHALLHLPPRRTADPSNRDDGVEGGRGEAAARADGPDTKPPEPSCTGDASRRQPARAQYPGLRGPRLRRPELPKQDAAAVGRETAPVQARSRRRSIAGRLGMPSPVRHERRGWL